MSSERKESSRTKESLNEVEDTILLSQESEEVCAEKDELVIHGFKFEERTEDGNIYCYKNRKSRSMKKSSRIRIIWIGIGGASHSGKSTLARNLKHNLGESCPLKVVRLDRYFRTNFGEQMPQHTIEALKEYGNNWETPESLKMDLFEEDLTKLEEKMIERIVTLNNENSEEQNDEENEGEEFEEEEEMKTFYIIVEGFLLFVKPEVCSYFHRMFWIEAGNEVCRIRRYRSQRLPPQIYDEVVWYHFLKYKDIQLENSKPIILDGTKVSLDVLNDCWVRLMGKPKKKKKKKKKDLKEAPKSGCTVM